MRQRIGTVLLLFVVMFGISQESQAALEWLHKLSGPGPFAGARTEFRFDCTQGDGCALFEWGLGAGLTSYVDGPWPAWTWSVAVGNMWSLDNDQEQNPGVVAPDVEIFTLEPAVQFWLEEKSWFAGFGLAYNRFSGRGFENFSRIASVFRIGKRFNRSLNRGAFEVGVKYLIFDEGFTTDDFAAADGDREERGVFGLFGTYFFGRQDVPEDDSDPFPVEGVE